MKIAFIRSNVVRSEFIARWRRAYRTASFERFKSRETSPRVWFIEQREYSTVSEIQLTRSFQLGAEAVVPINNLAVFVETDDFIF